MKEGRRYEERAGDKILRTAPSSLPQQVLFEVHRGQGAVSHRGRDLPERFLAHVPRGIEPRRLCREVLIGRYKTGLVPVHKVGPGNAVSGRDPT